MGATAHIVCLVGTRPEAIKMAPVIHALRQNPQLRTTVVTTGQHQEILLKALASFNIVADHELAVMEENQTLARLTSNVMRALDPVIEELSPDLVLAQGDTTSVFVAALVAFYRGVPFGHVEAGLRTGDLRSPFPEEFNRVVASKLASLHFAPTEAARQNLIREGADPETIYLTGNTVIDALFDVARRPIELPIEIESERRLILLTSHRRENFGAPLLAIISAARRLLANYSDVEMVYPVHPNPNVHDVVHRELGGLDRMHLLPPVDYENLVALMKRSHIVLTDSGGLQEEAPALGKPVLVLREVTERPEAVTAGVAKLIGCEEEIIVRETSSLLNDFSAYQSMSRGASPYGDGYAAQRIAEVIQARFLSS
ncbi:MAG: UDP-N-acetylglucosamine 2-epimerase (non-hydrolyzing) [Alphaproteobacteria bacterium]|nr:UDP-N-acetylglucosamine 2-epimerase (non-hydrolyzing) [Alphaproteobacteria bacterium]